MLPRVWAVGLTLSVAGFALAGGSAYEETLNQLLQSLGEINATLKTVESEESAGAAKPKLKAAAEAWTSARSKAAKLPPPEAAEKERLMRNYKPKLDEALKKLFREVPRVEAIPGGKDALKEISGVLKKDAK